MSGLSDSFQRPINYLRVSVTDRCNLRCVYCLPSEGFSLLPRAEILSFEEIRTVVQAAADLGITKVRLSGGEPLARAGLVNLVQLLSKLKGIEEISMTTNGVLLEAHAAELKQAGLRRVNISLDSLDPKRYESITGFDKLEEVLRGIRAAQEADLKPVKINMVVMGGINDDEVINFGRLSREEGWHVRFIELMPFAADSPRFVPIGDIQQRLAPLGKLEPCSPPTGGGPAKYYRFSVTAGTIGFIAPMSEHFCIRCNRLRLTADGKLLPCLMSDTKIDLLPLIRKAASRQQLKNIIKKAVAAKPMGHQLQEGVHSHRPMTQIGG